MRLPGLALAAALALLLPAAALPPPASAWVAGPTKPHHADLAVLAAERLPEPHRALLLRNLDAFRLGAMAPDGVVDPARGIHTFYHAYEPHDGGGGGVYRVKLSLREAAMALRVGAPEADVAYQMGILTHFVLDLSVPFHTGQDAYDHPLHERFEHAAYDHHAELPILAGAAVREVTDPEARAIALAEASSRLLPPLVQAMQAPDAAEGGWSAETNRLAGEAATMGVDATADFLHTAFLWADPARPEPGPIDDEMPVPKDAEDLGLSPTELAKHHPWLLASAGFVLLAAAVALATYAAARRRARRLADRPS